MGNTEPKKANNTGWQNQQEHKYTLTSISHSSVLVQRIEQGKKRIDNIFKMVVNSVQVFGKKKTATACAYCKNGRGLIKVNGQPIEHIQPEAFRLKVYEPILILGTDKFSNLDI